MCKINLKRLMLFLAAFATIFFSSCEKDDEVTHYEPRIILSQSSQAVPNTSSEHTVEILTNDSWEVKSSVNWIDLSESGGEEGRFIFSYSVHQNDDDGRIGVLSFSTTSGALAELEVTQEAGNRDDIYVKMNGTGEGFSWEEATSLENALQLAVTGNTIHIAEGTYTPTKTIRGGDESDDADKTFEISSNITLKGGYPADAASGTEADHSQYLTIFSGNGTSRHTVTISTPVSANDNKVVIQGITIRDGYNERSDSGSITIDGTNYPNNYGGGIIIGGGVVDIIDSEIIENRAGISAGIYAFNGTTLHMERSKLNNNIAEHHNGGVWMRSKTKFTMRDSEVRGNEGGGIGAGIYIYDASEFFIYNSIIADNSAGNHGGGLYIRQNSTGNLVNVIVANNTSGGTGAGLFIYNNSSVNMVNSTVVENSTTNRGGGIFGNSGANSIDIYNTIVAGNEQGSGAEIDEASSGALSATYRASAIGTSVYNENGQEISEVNFNPGSVQDSGDRFYIPIGDENPARVYGYSASVLIQLGKTLEPPVEEEIISKDLRHKSRTNLNVMGAIVE